MERGRERERNRSGALKAWRFIFILFFGCYGPSSFPLRRTLALRCASAEKCMRPPFLVFALWYPSLPPFSRQLGGKKIHRIHAHNHHKLLVMRARALTNRAKHIKRRRAVNGGHARLAGWRLNDAISVYLFMISFFLSLRALAALSSGR